MLNLEPCLPPVWAANGHAQTLLGHLLPSNLLPQPGEQHEVQLDDGDRLVCFVLKGSSKAVVYLFHGLSGNTDSAYMHRTARVCLDLGHSVVMVNHRGCGAGVGLARQPYHSGRAEDLSAVIAFGKKMFPNHTHLAIGFSLSGNALLLLLAGERGSHKPDYAISVNAPINLENAAVSLKRGLNRIYDLRFSLECRRAVAFRHRHEPGKYKIPLLTSVHDFDNLYTAPAAGFLNREHYYHSCSAGDLLANIQVPTIVLTAEDDPFVLFSDYAKARLSKSIHLHVEKFGGHMGYLTRTPTPLGTRRWLDYAIHEAARVLLA